MKKILLLGMAVAAMAVPVAFAGPPVHASSRLPAVSVQYTGNWAGYGDAGGSYHNVGAVWKVPALPATKSRAYAYFWVGMGGLLDIRSVLFGSGLVQIGIIELSGSDAGYYPFWEAIPRTDKDAKLTSSKPHYFRAAHGGVLTAEPGDFISASISLSGGTYFMQMSDGRGTNNTIWTTPKVPVSSSGVPNDSAEIVMEDPSGTPLAKFGQAFFDGAYIDDNAIGSTNPLKLKFYPFDQVSVSSIGANGDNFSISYPASQPAPSPSPVPVITSVGTYTSGAYVYFDIHYSDPGNNAEGFGFVGVDGSGWAEENHPFSSPSYGIVGQDSIAYPFNEACGTDQQYDSYVEAWIYDTAGARSNPVTIHLVCAGGQAS
jgi:peptidase A4-like protein